MWFTVSIREYKVGLQGTVPAWWGKKEPKYGGNKGVPSFWGEGGDLG